MFRGHRMYGEFMGRAHSEDLRREAVDYVREHGTYTAAAEEFDLSITTVSRWCRTEGVVSEETSHHRHGLSRYMDNGCRCAECMKAFADALYMCIAYDGGQTLEEIGQDVGLDRERVRQIINQVDPDFTVNVRFERRSAKEREHVYSRLKQCLICGQLTLGRKTCGGPCSDAYSNSGINHHLMDGRKRSHKKATARWALANPDHPDVNQYKIDHARRVLADEDNYRGEWLVEGGGTWRVAMQAFLSGAPLYDELPDQIRDQVRRAAERRGLVPKRPMVA